MRITATRAADDFNRYLASKHAQSSKLGTPYKLEFSKLTEEINKFRISQYKSFDPSEVPEVHEIEAELRRKWGLKASGTRKIKSEALKRLKADMEEKARQYELPL